MLVRTKGELTYTFEFANIAHHDQLTSFSMLGTKGGIHMSGHDGTIRYRTEKGGPWQFVEHTSTWREQKKQDALAYEQIAMAIKEGTEITAGTTTAEAKMLHTTMAMAYLSARERREVTVEEVQPDLPIFTACWVDEPMEVVHK